MADYTTEDSGGVDGYAAFPGLTWSELTDTLVLLDSEDTGTARTEWAGFLVPVPHTLSEGDGFGGVGHSTIDPIGVSDGTTFTVRFVTTGIGVSVATMTLYVVPEPDASAWSTSLLPGTRGELAIATRSFDSGLNPDTGIEWVTNGNEPIVFTLDALGLSRVNAVLKSSRYRGSLFLSLEADFSSGVGITLAASQSNDFTTPTLSAVEFSDHTGFLEFGTERGRGRASHDGRLGLPIFSPDMVEDDYVRGLWVRPEDRDPEDPLDTYRPKSTEGGREPDGRP